ncbi:MAG: hypothetical protein JHC95_20760 [Solirubrobacteraceae bacterium]|nr:hypothetical protein [Solirubrobacteraceae bacterium]
MNRRAHDEQASTAIGEELRAAVQDVHAPPEVRAEVARARLRSAPGIGMRRVRLTLVSAAGSAAVGAAALALLLGGGAADPSLTDMARAALLPPAQPAPAARRDGTLAVAVGGVPFPGAARAGGWQPLGTRSDTLGDRTVRTVTYRRGGRVASYSIVDGPALELPDGATRTTYDDVDAAVLRRDGMTIVTWERGGRTCILASATAGAARLLEFAASA